MPTPDEITAAWNELQAFKAKITELTGKLDSTTERQIEANDTFNAQIQRLQKSLKSQNQDFEKNTADMNQRLTKAEKRLNAMERES